MIKLTKYYTVKVTFMENSNTISKSETSLQLNTKQSKQICFRAQFTSYTICFIFAFLLCWLFPYTGDDWTWGTQVGIDRLNSWFDNYSGRYFGNLIVLALTRSNLLKAFTMAFCYTGIFAIIQKITKYRYAFIISVLFFMLTPKAVAAQTIVWTSGFANYCTSIALTFLYFIAFFWVFEDKNENNLKNLKQRPFLAILLLILGCANTLIVEHITLYNVVLSLFVVIFILIKFKKVLLQYVAYAIGAIGGTLYMFSNSVYHSVAKGDDFYRTVAFSPLDIIKQAIKNYFDIIYKEFYMNNIWINLAIFVVCFVIVKQIKNNFSKRIYNISKVCLLVNGIYVLWSFVSVISLEKEVKLKSLIYAEGIATIISGGAIITLLIIISFYKKQLMKMLFIIGSILFITTTLFVVTPVSSRCFFAGYILFILLLVNLCTLLSEETNEKIKTFGISGVLKIMVASILVFNFLIFGSIYSVSDKRMEHVQEKIQAGETKIEVLRQPYESYLWLTTPINSNFWRNAFKDFHGIPRDIELVFVKEYSDSKK